MTVSTLEQGWLDFVWWAQTKNTPLAARQEDGSVLFSAISHTTLRIDTSKVFWGLEVVPSYFTVPAAGQRVFALWNSDCGFDVPLLSAAHLAGCELKS